MTTREEHGEPEEETMHPSGEDDSPPENDSEGDREGGPEGARERISDGFRQGIGVLSAFKDALEETIQDARDRGELSTDRARSVVQGAVDRVREAAGDAKERLDFARQEELDALRNQVAELRARLEELEQGEKGGSSSPEAGGVQGED
jgi:polyhydroxyalkanoate synthesis regulator phasin